MAIERVMKHRELVAFKCERCGEQIVSEKPDAMLETAAHLFDRHRDDQVSGKEYAKRFPNGSFTEVKE